MTAGYVLEREVRLAASPGTRTMIDRFRVQNYKALRDVTLELTPIHVLIGPNDSGKTSILEAITALCRSVDYPIVHAFPGKWDGTEFVWAHDVNLSVRLAAWGTIEQKEIKYAIVIQFPVDGKQAWIIDELLRVDTPNDKQLTSPDGRRASTYVETLQSQSRKNDPHWPNTILARAFLSGVQICELDPRQLWLPCAPDGRFPFRMFRSGFGLARCLDELVSFDHHRFDEMEKRFLSIFPSVKAIRLRSEKHAYKSKGSSEQFESEQLFEMTDGKGVFVEFNTGLTVPANLISDGMLIVLAYLTILLSPEPPRVLLVEEPENGIHPKRLEDVLKILRQLASEQSHTQVILTTHSPYAVDLFDPTEVSLCHKQKDGSVSVKRMSDIEIVKKQADVFTLGEIWTAEGDENLANGRLARMETDS